MRIKRKRLFIELVIASVILIVLIIYSIPRFLQAQLVEEITESACVYSEGKWQWDGNSVKQVAPVLYESILVFRPAITQGEIRFKAYSDAARGTFQIYFGLSKPFKKRLYWDLGGYRGNTTGIMDLIIHSVTQCTLGDLTNLVPFPFTPKKWYNIRMVIRDGGHTIEGYVDNTLIQTYKSLTPIEGSLGIGTQRTSAAQFQDIKIIKEFKR